MAQIAIYLNDELEQKVSRAAQNEKISRSAWVKEAILKHIEEPGLPESWFKVWGSWEDDKSPEEIFQEIRKGSFETHRVSIK